MMIKSRFLFAALFSILLVRAGFAAETESEKSIVLTRDSQTSWSLTILNGRHPELMTERAADLIAGTLERWGGARPPVVRLKNGRGRLPAGPAIVLATLDQLNETLPDLASGSEAIRRAAFIDEQGFTIAPIEDAGAQRLFIVSKTARGVFNGAQYLHDFGIDGPRAGLRTPNKTLTRSPWMSGRAVYLLTIWNNERLYTAQDWAAVFDSFVRDGNDRVYFWMSGHFPSKKFPQTYNIVNMDGDKVADRTDGTRIGTVADLRQIIVSAHERGLKLYLGGAIGGWCGTRFITNSRPGTMKTGPATHSLCPSHPLVRSSLVEYYTEMFDALPEADGVYLESADEDGACECPACTRVIDDQGSKQFGQAQLTLVQEIAASVWRRHPHARFAYTIGYREHIKEPPYYETVRQMSTDPRFEWMEARGAWAYPGPGGRELPPSFFSPQVMRWHPYEILKLDAIVEIANRAAKSGFCGMISDFSPGFDSGSFYMQIPYPTDTLPYRLTGFIFRELTWDPTLTMDRSDQPWVESRFNEARRRIRDGFFGAEAPEPLVEDLIAIRELIRDHQNKNADTVARKLKALDMIEQRVNLARPGANPKTLDTLDLMVRAITDARADLSKTKS